MTFKSLQLTFMSALLSHFESTKIISGFSYCLMVGSLFCFSGDKENEMEN